MIQTQSYQYTQRVLTSFLSIKPKSELPEIKQRVRENLKEKLADFLKVEKQNEKDVKSLQIKLESLTEKFIEDVIDHTTYQKLKSKYELKIKEKERQISNTPINSSNLEKGIKNGMKICLNASSL